MSKFWLMKNEVADYSIDDMQRDRKALWTGVRNYQARNFMHKEMTVGDLALFYHSNADPSGAAGVIRVSRPAQADPTALEKKSPYYDAKATKENPIWFCVEVEFVKKLERLVSIQEMRGVPALAKMKTLQKGSRLSITPLTKDEFQTILKLSGTRI